MEGDSGDGWTHCALCLIQQSVNDGRPGRAKLKTAAGCSLYSRADVYQLMRPISSSISGVMSS